MLEKHFYRKSRLATRHPLLVLTAALSAVVVAKTTTASAALAPIGVSGFNADTIIDAAASAPAPGHNFGVVNEDGTNESGTGVVYTSSTNVITSDINEAGSGAYLNTGYVHNGEQYFQSGWNNLTTGLPAAGSFTSAYTNPQVGAPTVFQYGYNGVTTDYADNNTLYFTTSTARTLSLIAPLQTTNLAFLAAAELQANYTTHTQFDVTLNFSDSTSDTYSQAIVTGPSGDNAASTSGVNNAISVTGDFNGNGSKSTWTGAFMTESDLALTPADQAKTIVSITFTPDPLNAESGLNGLANPAGIYAISAAVPEPVSFATLAGIGGFTLLGRRRRDAK